MKNDFVELNKVYDLLSQFSKPWFICGGWAIDLALGKKTREHTDIDIGIFREDQLELQNYLSDWDFYKVLPEGNRETVTWKKGEYLELPIHETRARKEDHELEFLLNNSDATHWIYRRNEKVRFPKNKLIRYRDSLPYWAPEISLLYKASVTRPHDEEDFKNSMKFLSPEAQQWLQQSIQSTHPGHHWLARFQ